VHALILAGGEGRRLAADGVRVPKPLVLVGGRPQLLRLVETLEALGCESLTCMLREGIPSDAIADTGSHRRKVVSCRTPSSLHTLALGFAEVPAGTVFCTMVDTVMPWHDWLRAWTACAGALARGAPAVLVVAPTPERDEHPLRVRTDAAGHVAALGADLEDARWATAGVYGFGAAARARAALAVAQGIERMRGFLTLLVREGAMIPLVPIQRALDLDRRADLEAANAWAPAFAPEHERTGGRP
jgi:molybdopterin-guanine dinucleotide biosynthesis protein A